MMNSSLRELPEKRLGAAQNEVVVTFMDGEEVRGVIQMFNPQLPTFFLYVVGSMGELIRREIRLEGVKMISFLRDPSLPKPKVAFPSSARLVTVRFVDQKIVCGVTQGAGGARAGLFIVPIKGDDVTRLFVPLSAIRDVIVVQQLSEIVTGKGMITPEMIQRRIRELETRRDEEGCPIVLQKEVVGEEPLEVDLVMDKQRARKRIGDILLEQGFIDQEQLKEAIEARASQQERKLGEILVSLGHATYKMIGIALSIQYNIPFMNLSTQVIDPQLRDLVPVKVARRWQVMPLSLHEGLLTVAIADPTEESKLDELRNMTGLAVIKVLATPRDIVRTIDRFYDPSS
jgi:hypothetical protein